MATRAEQAQAFILSLWQEPQRRYPLLVLAVAIPGLGLAGYSWGIIIGVTYLSSLLTYFGVRISKELSALREQLNQANAEIVQLKSVNVKSEIKKVKTIQKEFNETAKAKQDEIAAQSQKITEKLTQIEQTFQAQKETFENVQKEARTKVLHLMQQCNLTIKTLNEVRGSLYQTGKRLKAETATQFQALLEQQTADVMETFNQLRTVAVQQAAQIPQHEMLQPGFLQPEGSSSSEEQPAAGEELGSSENSASSHSSEGSASADGDEHSGDETYKSPLKEGEQSQSVEPPGTIVKKKVKTKPQPQSKLKPATLPDPATVAATMTPLKQLRSSGSRETSIASGPIPGTPAPANPGGNFLTRFIWKS